MNHHDGLTNPKDIFTQEVAHLYIDVFKSSNFVWCAWTGILVRIL